MAYTLQEILNDEESTLRLYFDDIADSTPRSREKEVELSAKIHKGGLARVGLRGQRAVRVGQACLVHGREAESSLGMRGQPHGQVQEAALRQRREAPHGEPKRIP